MKFAGKHVDDQIGKILQDAVDRGWIFEGTTHKGHFKLRHPNSNQIQICGDSGDPAACHNVRARLKRVERQFGDLTKSRLAEQLEKIASPEIRLVTGDDPTETPQAPTEEDHAMKKTETIMRSLETVEAAIERMERMDPVSRDLRRAIALYAIGGTSQSAIGPLFGRSLSWYSAYVRPKILDIKMPFYTDDDLIAVASAGQRGVMPAPTVKGDALRFSKAWVDHFIGEYRSVPQKQKAPTPKPSGTVVPPETNMFETVRPTQSLRDAKDAFVTALADLERAIQAARAAGMDLEVVGLPAAPPRILVKTVRDI